MPSPSSQRAQWCAEPYAQTNGGVHPINRHGRTTAGGGFAASCCVPAIFTLIPLSRRFDDHTLCIYSARMEFTWSEAKRGANLKAHGLDFVDAPLVFEGVTFTFEDDRFA